MVDLKQRAVIRGYLSRGMSPVSVTNYLGRVADLEESDLVLIRAVAEEILNEQVLEGNTASPR